MSRKVLEFIHNDFGFILQRNFAFQESIQIDPYVFPASGRNARRKHMLMKNSLLRSIGASCNGCERSLPGFPMDGMRKNSGRNIKADNVEWDIVRLDYVLCVVIVSKPPPANLDIKFAPVFFRSYSVPGKQSQNGLWFHVRNISHREPVSSISEAARQPDFRASPIALAAPHAQVKGAFVVRPSIVRNKWNERSTAITAARAHYPVISTKVESLSRWWTCHLTLALNDGDGRDSGSSRGKRFGCARGFVSWIN